MHRITVEKSPELIPFQLPLTAVRCVYTAQKGDKVALSPKTGNPKHPKSSVYTNALHLRWWCFRKKLKNKNVGFLATVGDSDAPGFGMFSAPACFVSVLKSSRLTALEAILPRNNERTFTLLLR